MEFRDKRSASLTNVLMDLLIPILEATQMPSPIMERVSPVTQELLQDHQVTANIVDKARLSSAQNVIVWDHLKMV